MKEQVVFVVRDKCSPIVSAYKKVCLANAILCGVLLAIKLYNELEKIEEKELSKGE